MKSMKINDLMQDDVATLNITKYKEVYLAREGNQNNNRKDNRKLRSCNS